MAGLGRQVVPAGPGAAGPAAGDVGAGRPPVRRRRSGMSTGAIVALVIGGVVGVLVLVGGGARPRRRPSRDVAPPTGADDGADRRRRRRPSRPPTCPRASAGRGRRRVDRGAGPVGGDRRPTTSTMCARSPAGLPRRAPGDARARSPPSSTQGAVLVAFDPRTRTLRLERQHHRAPGRSAARAWSRAGVATSWRRLGGEVVEPPISRPAGRRRRCASSTRSGRRAEATIRARRRAVLRAGRRQHVHRHGQHAASDAGALADQMIETFRVDG